MTLLTIFIVHLFAVATPGPDFFLVTRTALSGYCRTERITVALGIACGGAVWTILSLLGLGQLIARFPFLYQTLSIFGALYLFYLAYQIMRHAHDAIDFSEQKIKTSSLFRTGLLTNLSNAKAIMYFVGIFSAFQVIYQNISIGLFVTAVIFLETLIWFILTGELFSRTTFRRLYARRRVMFEYAAAIVFALFALLIIRHSFFQAA